MEHIGIDTYGLDQPENEEYTADELLEMNELEQEIDNLVYDFLVKFGKAPEISYYIHRS